MRIKKMKKLLVFLFSGSVLFVTTSFADPIIDGTNTTKVGALEADTTKRMKFNPLGMRLSLVIIQSDLEKVTKNTPEKLKRIEDLKKQEEDYKILIKIHSLGEEMCSEFRKLAVRSESNESNANYLPAYEHLCFFPNP
jgi:hypothetical protein